MEVGPEIYKNEVRSNGWRGQDRKSRVQTCSVMHSQVTPDTNGTPYNEYEDLQQHNPGRNKSISQTVQKQHMF